MMITLSLLRIFLQNSRFLEASEILSDNSNNMYVLLLMQFVTVQNGVWSSHSSAPWGQFVAECRAEWPKRRIPISLSQCCHLYFPSP